jgi:hypothetical protein
LGTKEDLSKFGYKTNKEIKNSRNFIKYWQTTKAYYLNMAMPEETSYCYIYIFLFIDEPSSINNAIM